MASLFKFNCIYSSAFIHHSSSFSITTTTNLFNNTIISYTTNTSFGGAETEKKSVDNV